VLVYAPRRYGKSSLVLAAARQAVADGVLVGYCDLLRITTKERFAATLAKTIHRDIDSATGEILERAAALFRSLRIRPTMELDPEDASLSFSFRGTRRKADIDETVEALLELLGRLAAERQRRVVMIFDEFQEIVDLDADFPKLLRSVFQAQPDVCHVYLGSKRHVMRDLFSDANEPFWRSAKQMEIGLIPSDLFGPFVVRRFNATNKGLDQDACDQLLEITRGHPYATQELCYSLWEQTPFDGRADGELLARAMELVLQSEHAHFSLVWDGLAAGQRVLLEALAREPGRPLSAAYRDRHQLAAPSSIQVALKALIGRELIEREQDGGYRVMEPFLAEWLADFVS
jgi:uncharacterized protein